MKVKKRFMNYGTYIIIKEKRKENNNGKCNNKKIHKCIEDINIRILKN